MQSELDSIHNNGTWDLVPFPNGRKGLPCKQVYRYKYTTNSALPNYKARIVAKGQEEGQAVDFDEIFSPVVKMATLRVIVTLVAKKDLGLFQINVKTDFLHGDLDEEIYMEQPKGYEVHEKMPLVCKLNKSLYLLKKSPQKWYRQFDAFMTSQVMIGARKTHAYKQRNLQMTHM